MTIGCYITTRNVAEVSAFHNPSLVTEVYSEGVIIADSDIARDCYHSIGNCLMPGRLFESWTALGMCILSRRSRGGGSLRRVV